MSVVLTDQQLYDAGINALIRIREKECKSEVAGAIICSHEYKDEALNLQLNLWVLNETICTTVSESQNQKARTTVSKYVEPKDITP